MWYRFEEDNPIGVCRVKNYQVAWYDMERNGDCFDEEFFSLDEIGLAISYVETIEDESNIDRTRVFVHFDNGETYELKLEKISAEQYCGNFYGKII